MLSIRHCLLSLSVCLSIYLSIYLYLCLCLCLYLYLYLYLYISLSLSIDFFRVCFVMFTKATIYVYVALFCVCLLSLG